MTSSIRQILTDAASSRSDDIWLVTPETEKSFSWQDTQKRAETIARYLQGAGLSKGASVAIAAPNGAAASFAFLGVVREFFIKESLPGFPVLKTLDRFDNHTADFVFPG